jgi:hypothetical protein
MLDRVAATLVFIEIPMVLIVLDFYWFGFDFLVVDKWVPLLQKHQGYIVGYIGLGGHRGGCLDQYLLLG